ncbi:TIGR01621 family pseudouridine synthase [Vibrio sp. SCSIO 43135]|uniref:TIGR01621 family pseudouridine synthase n=1 Tax=Vibrio sp. SCSIO 43135 TaxID=2819096 RepID=UPI00207521EB|nr:TIGR01621 family pseudouridine synthase [Vibrio sp. SCSIO 43135]USD40147.1 TIGR01621 family pseudouridine synthase [Vibrio sp. SCSIO 43135]
MFDILYTHHDFLVINKHPNVSVHKDDGDTMLLQEVAKVSGDSQLYLVHRLDKMTSGLLILARNAQAASELSKQFADRLVEKFYLAIGSKKPKKKQGLIVGDMERSRRSSWKLVSSQSNPAVTQFFSLAGEPGQRLFLCKPYTGKTHQIRVALKSVGSGIEGDPIYNSASQVDRGYLHAFALRIAYSGEQYEFVCDPRSFENFGQLWTSEPVSNGIESWLTPWALSWPKLPTSIQH